MDFAFLMEYQLKTEIAKYSSKHPLIRYAVAKFQNDFNNIISPMNLNSVLDVGCGIGVLLKSVRKLKPNISITGVDILESCLEQARKNNPDSTFFQANIYQLPFADECFDLVMSCEVLEHLNDLETAILELKRVSKRHCLISVPNEPLFSIANLFRFTHILRLGNYPGHLHKFSRKSLEKFLKQHFNNVQIKTSTIWLIAVCEK